MTPTKSIIIFNKERGLTSFNGEAEYKMLKEELDEFLTQGVQAGDTHETVDALCDIIVLATGALWKLGYEPNLALKQTCKEITSRKGSLNASTGKWEKDPNQAPSTLYKANYALAKRAKD